MTRGWDWPGAVSRRTTGLFSAISALLAVVLVFGLAPEPSYTDADYHFNAGVRLVSGLGLTDAYLFTYHGAPDELRGEWSVPSHTYWMPLSALMAATGMAVARAPGSYAAAQIPFALAAWGVALIGFAVGARLGRSAFFAWVAGLLTILSPFYAFYWGAIDSTTPFALAGGGCLLLLGLLVSAGATRGRTVWGWLLAGVLAGAAHLARPDGLLFLGLALLFALDSARRARSWRGLWMPGPVLLGYALVMLPWWLRSTAALGTPLPVSGFEGIVYTEYNDLFNYPAGATFERFVATLGWQGFVTTRWLALVGEGGLSGNVGTLIAVEGMIFLAPFMVIGWARRWRDPFLWPFGLAALTIHGVMTLVFPFAGYRGGLLHSAGALLPFWAALGALGVRDAIGWIAQRRRKWHAATATWIFGSALVVFACALLLTLAARGPRLKPPTDRALYAEVDRVLPEGARLLSVDPPGVYAVTGRGGAVLPNSPPDVLPEIASRFEVGYLLLQEGRLPGPLSPVWESAPDFLTAIPLTTPGGRLYAIDGSTPVGS